MPATPKYRALTTQELHELEKEFIEYLIVNGITAGDWVKIKQNEPDKAESILILFSDVVFEGTLRKISFLEKRLPNELLIFQCLKDRIVLVGITSPSVDFTDQTSLEQAVNKPPGDAMVYTTEKSYSQVREMELFKMIDSGCTITDGKLFKTLSLAL
ncbi:MAG: DUF6495 family protein [Bacteroidota bacterium]